MLLGPGARLGPYEVVAPLGAGGMGEVYRARDTRLDRTVAIKILPAQFSGDPQFRDRFEREARAISSLNHPHICTLYDVGHHDGTDYLVMEYLEGETLADRLAKGALPLEQALQCAVQMAAALDNAHRHGIVHRDLKPGNIMVTKSGIKVLDFGLAKTGAPAVAGAGLSMLPTTPPNLTAHGAILGTFQYMAPEQLEGQEADARTDIFAFGAVIYEMIAGKKAFEGKSQASLIASILDHEPPAISTFQPVAPAALDRVVRKCLDKDPDDRWQTARDLYSELKWISEGPNATAAAPPTKARRHRTHLAWTATSIAAAVATAFAVVYFRDASGGGALARFSVSPPPNEAFNAASPVSVVSPDGRRVAFIASRPGDPYLLWVRSLDALEARPLPGTEGAAFPFWSPDSRLIAFFAGGKLKKIDSAGGPVQTLSDAQGGMGGTWNRDDVIVFAPSLSSRLFKVAAAGGQPTPVTTLNASTNENAHRFPAFLPDGRHFLYFAVPSNTIWLGSLDSTETTRLVDSDAQAQYSMPGYLIFVRQGTLLAQPFDAQRLMLTGEVVPVADEVAPDATSRYAAFSVADNGVMAYRTGVSSPRTQFTWFDRTGRAIGTAGPPGRYRNPVLSLDGARLAIEATDPQTGTQDIWLMELERGIASRLTLDPGNDIYPVWSPDGSHVTFGSDRGGNGVFNIYQKLANGADQDKLIVKSSDDMAPYSWSQDGRYLVYRLGFANQRNIGILSMVGDPDPRPFLPPPPSSSTFINQTAAQLSPDGRWIVYTSSESGRFEVYVRNFPVPAGKWQISQGGAVFPRWRGDGKEIFYYGDDGRLMAVPIKSDTAIEAGTPVPLFDARMLNGPRTGVGFRGQYVTRDGQRFLINVPLDETASSPITVVLNWTAGLKK